MFFNKTNKIALFIAVALGYGGLVDVYAQDSFFNTWFNVDNFDKDSKARKQQARALWSTPHARAARMALMEEQHRRVEELATFLMRPNDKGEKMAPMTAYEQAWNMVYTAARRDAKRAMNAEPVRAMLENPDGVDELAWIQAMTPEIIHGLIYALEEQFDGFDYRDDGRDARRAYLLTRALEKEGWTKAMDENEFTAALQQEALKQAAYLMAVGVDPSDAFKIACVQVHASSQISSFLQSTGPVVWSGPGTAAEQEPEPDPEQLQKFVEAVKKIAALAAENTHLNGSTQTNGQSLATHASAAPVAVSAPVAPHAVSGGGAGGAGASGGGSAGGSSAASSVDYSAIFRLLASGAAPTDATRESIPTVTWKGNLADLKDGVSATFNNDSTGQKYLDVTLTDVWRPYEIVVNDQGVPMSKHGVDGNKPMGEIAYAFNGSGSIGDYTDDGGTLHHTSVTKQGSGILVMANGGNSYSGGTDVQQGVVYVADQGALGTGEVTLHDGTALWVNYAWNRDFGSSFRNPVVSNTINLSGESGKAVSATVSYGNFPYQKVLGNDSSRIWRNMYLTGGIAGNAQSHLLLQSYNSRYGAASSSTSTYFTAPRLHIGGTIDTMRSELWYGGFILNRSEALTEDERFYGTVTLGNRVNTSAASADNLASREAGAVKLVLSDDVLEYATLDATREWGWVRNQFSSTQTDFKTEVTAQNELLLKGTVGGAEVGYTQNVSEAVRAAYEKLDKSYANFSTYGLLQTHSNTILISDNSKIGELKADLLGVTQDSYRDAIEWSEALEVGMVRVATLEEKATLTLGKNGSKEASWFSGTVGFENLLCDFDGDGKDTMTKANMNGLSDTPTTKVGINLVKVGNNTQYIHSAKLHNLDVQGGTLGFNNVQLVNNLTLASGTTLQLGVQNEQWKDTGTVKLLVGDNSGDKHRFAVVTADTDERAKGAPLSARVEGSLKLDTSTELAFEVSTEAQDSGERMNIVPAWVKEEDTLKDKTDYLSSHSLLQVTAATQRTDADKGGTLTLNNDTAITISGVNFLKENYEDKVYFLAAADKIAVNKGGVIGNASDFDTRVITLGYGYYGIISTIDGYGTNLNGGYSAYGKDNAAYLGQDYLVMRVAADPTRSWTGSTQTSAAHAANIWTASPEKTYAEYLTATENAPDAQWKENRAYTDGVSVKFGNLWMPYLWQDYLEKTPDAKVEDFRDLLTSGAVTKVVGTTFTQANGTPEGEGNGTTVLIGGILNGREGSTYTGAHMEGHNDHYEKVVIKGTVRPGYVTINSDFNLRQGDGTYITVQDDTNYVFTGEDYVDEKGVVHPGCIADATTERMKEIYGSSSMLDDWKTGLSKGGTGALVILTENSYSGGTNLHGGLTVMGNKWALGMADPTLSKDNAAAKGGAVEMSYGAGLMADYLTKDAALGGVSGTMSETTLTNDLTITHMADYDNTKAKGDAQLFNRYDSILTANTLSSYDDAILTLRGVSLAEDSELARKEGDDRLFYTYGKYIITNPVKAQGTIRMAGYLYGDDGSLVDLDGDAYMNGGGKVQLTITGHKAGSSFDVLWGHTTIDLSLNGSKENVLAIGTRIIPGANGSVEINQNGATPLAVELHTLKDDGLSGHNARVINEASAGQMNGLPRTAYQVTLTLAPSSDASFSGDIGFGMGQNAEGAAMPSRGYISLVKSGAALQSVGNARLLDLTVNGSGLMHVQESLSARSISTTNAGAQHIHVGHVGDAVMSHTLTVGKDGILSFDTTLSSTSKLVDNDPLKSLQPGEGLAQYGQSLSYVLLKDGATLTGSGNWYTEKCIAVAGGSNITFNTHDYSMDNTVSTDMAVYGDEGQRLHDAFDDSHIICLQKGLSGENVTLNLVNEQMSAGATEAERGTATANGYFITRDLNQYQYEKNSKGEWLYNGLGGSSTVNIGAKTILQSYESAKADTGLTYNVTGTDAALQFLDANSDKLKLTDKLYGGVLGVTSYVHDATLSKGGRIILGGAAAASSKTLVNTDALDANITKDADVVITNKDGQTATVTGMTVNTKNDATDGVTYETTLSSDSRAGVEHAEMTVKNESSVNNTRVQKTDFSDTLISLQNKCSVSLENVLVTSDSKIEGADPASGNMGATALAKGATAASDQTATSTVPSNLTKGSVTMTDADTRINVSLSNSQNVKVGNGIIQVNTADQLSKTDVGGKGLTLGLSKDTLEKAGKAGVHFIAIQVSDSGRFLYEQEGSLANVKLTNHNGVEYAAGDIESIDPNFVVKVVSSEYVAQVLGVDKSEVSKTLLYIEIPEPATALLSLFALAGMAARRRRK